MSVKSPAAGSSSRAPVVAGVAIALLGALVGGVVLWRRRQPSAHNPIETLTGVLVERRVEVAFGLIALGVGATLLLLLSP